MIMSLFARLSAAVICIGVQVGYAADASLEQVVDSAIAQIERTVDLDEVMRRDLKREITTCLLRHRIMSEMSKALDAFQEKCKVDRPDSRETEMLRDMVDSLGRLVELVRAPDGNDKSLEELQQIVESIDTLRVEIESDEVLERLDAEFEGFCPVSLRKTRGWVVGTPKYRFTVDGKTYLMSSEEHLREFKSNPGEYIPVDGGFDVVAASKNERIKGVRAHGLVYRGRVYLFATEENLKEFANRPQEFTPRNSE